MIKFNTIKSYRLIIQIVTIAYCCLFSINSTATLITRGTNINAYDYIYKDDTHLKTLGHYNSRLSTFKCDDDSTADMTMYPCTWHIFNPTDLKPAAIPNDVICKQVFQFNALPANTTKHLMSYDPIKFTELTLDGNKITDLAKNGDIPWILGQSGTIITQPFKGITLTWRHGTADAEGNTILNQLPYTYGSAAKKFVISELYPNLAQATNISSDTSIPSNKDAFDKLCLSEPDKYGSGTLARVVILDDSDNELEKKLVCLHNNTYSELGNDSMIVTDLMPDNPTGTSTNWPANIFFWSETPKTLTIEQITQDKIPSCFQDTDNDLLPNFLDTCPNQAPTELVVGGIGTSILRDELTAMSPADRYSEILEKYEIDQDGDGTGDNCDNCILAFNPDQSNPNGNCIFAATTEQCTMTTFDNITCDIVEDTEKTAVPINENNPFNAINVEFTLPRFEFDSKDLSDYTSDNRTCQLGEVRVGSSVIIDCQNPNDENYNLFCEFDCVFNRNNTGSSCFYNAKFRLAPSKIKELAPNITNINNFFDDDDDNTNDVPLYFQFEVFISSDYDNTDNSTIGNYTSKINTPSNSASISLQDDTNYNKCTISASVQKELIELKNVTCNLRAGGSDYINIHGLEDYIEAVGISASHCGL